MDRNLLCRGHVEVLLQEQRTLIESRECVVGLEMGNVGMVVELGGWWTPFHK